MRSNHATTQIIELPVGPGSIGDKFKSLCEPFPDDFAVRMQGHVRDFLTRVAEVTDPRFHKNLRDAVWVAEQCYRLLEGFKQLTPQQQLLAVGAVRYFVIHADSVHDYSPITGFADDKLVLEHALGRIAACQETAK